MPVPVRRAVAEDAAGIAAVHVSSWQEAYRGIVPDDVLDGLSVAQREAFWRSTLSVPEPPSVYVAEDGDELVGFCAVGAPSRDEGADPRTAEIGAIYVLPSSWRAGVGSALMNVALADLGADGWESVTLWVLAENRAARDFYARFGFAADGAQTVHEGSGSTEVRLRASLAA